MLFAPRQLSAVIGTARGLFAYMVAARKEPESAMTEPTPPQSERSARRSFLSMLSSLAMFGGLAGGYGLFVALAARYLLPARPLSKGWFFVAGLDDLSAGGSLTYRSPAGQLIVVTRLDKTGSADDFIALSSVCPHLGCRVHWEAGNDRFFCPCHNGAFDKSGDPIAGPPAEAGQSLSQYPLKIENGMLFIRVPTASLAELQRDLAGSQANAAPRHASGRS